MAARPDDADRRLFRNRLRQVVGKSGSIAAVATSIGVSESTLKRWLSGSTQPTRDDLVAVARYGEVAAGWLVAGELVSVSGAPWLRTINVRDDGQLSIDLRGHEIAEVRWSKEETWLVIRPRRPRLVRG